jgi:cytochrome c oxidase subunit II
MNCRQRFLSIAAFTLACFLIAGICLAETNIPTVVIHAQRYQFDPSEISLVQGKKVKLIFISDDVAHGIVVDELGISTLFSKTHPAVIMITPATLGTFRGQCSRYCGSGHNQMQLTIRVIARQ